MDVKKVEIDLTSGIVGKVNPPVHHDSGYGLIGISKPKGGANEQVLNATEVERVEAVSTVEPCVIEAFCRELTELSLKHGVVIEACGCCGSPFFSKAGYDEVPANGHYVICRSGNSIFDYTDLEWVEAGEKI